MPLYTALVEEGSLADRNKVEIGKEITRIHATVMKVPREFVRVVFILYAKGAGCAAGVPASTAALDCTLRSGHTVEDKAELLTQLWEMFQRLSGTASDLLAISLAEVPASNAMEMGHIMRPVAAR
jgi:phenylpyruvate tautomerase PptA (4-oxalocrotonate tautomerase family)